MTRSLPVVRLRAIEPEDLDMLYGIENDTKLWNVSVTSVPYSRYTLYDYIANSKNDIYSDRQVRMMVENGGGEVVGIVDLINFDPKHLRAEIGIVIKREYRNQGYAQAAIGEICDYALNVLHLHQLYALVNRDNPHSLKLFEKTGFSVSSELKDWLFDGKNYHNAVLMQLFL
jgi:diamine N-acetyltransferase